MKGVGAGCMKSSLLILSYESSRLEVRGVGGGGKKTSEPAIKIEKPFETHRGKKGERAFSLLTPYPLPRRNLLLSFVRSFFLGKHRCCTTTKPKWKASFVFFYFFLSSSRPPFFFTTSQRYNLLRVCDENASSQLENASIVNLICRQNSFGLFDWGSQRACVWLTLKVHYYFQRRNKKHFYLFLVRIS